MIIKQLDDQYIANTYNTISGYNHQGKGSIVWDEQGKEYIDLSGGIAVNTFGFADQDWLEAINNQLNQVQHTSNLYYTEPATKLAELLCQQNRIEKGFFLKFRWGGK